MSHPDVEYRWRTLSEEVITSLTDWRVQHPQATLAEIEAALATRERLDRLRARMLEDSALASEQTNWTAANRPRCPNGGQLLQRGGQRIRRLQTRGKQTLTLTRQYGREACPACGQGLFPLDAELALLPGCLTPTLQEHLVRLGTWMPFRSAAQLLSRRRRHALDRDQ